jgi:hypothetical protein
MDRSGKLQQIEHYVHSLLQSTPEDDVDKKFVFLMCQQILRTGKRLSSYLLWWGSVGTPDFRGNSSSCTDTPPVFLAVSTSFLAIKHSTDENLQMKSRTFAGVDGRIDGQAGRAGFTDSRTETG